MLSANVASPETGAVFDRVRNPQRVISSEWFDFRGRRVSIKPGGKRVGTLRLLVWCSQFLLANAITARALEHLLVFIRLTSRTHIATVVFTNPQYP